MTDRADIEALLALLAKATTADPRHARLAQCLCVACEDRERFYVAAVNALPALCAELREARAKAAAFDRIAGVISRPSSRYPLGGRMHDIEEILGKYTHEEPTDGR